MKKILSIFLTILLVVFVNGQQLNVNQQKTNPDYFRKGNSNQTLGWIMTAGGAALVIGGLVVNGSNQSYVPNKTIGTIMIVGGGIAAVTGVIILTSANNKKSEVENFSLNLKMENALSINSTGMKNNYYPAAAFKVRLNK
jgi:hypothetical protein